MKPCEASIIWPGDCKKEKKLRSAINDWLWVRFSAGIKYSTLLNNRDARRPTTIPCGWDTSRGARKPAFLTRAYPEELTRLCVAVVNVCQPSIMQILGRRLIKAPRRFSVPHYSETRTRETERSGRVPTFSWERKARRITSLMPFRRVPLCARNQIALVWSLNKCL